MDKSTQIPAQIPTKERILASGAVLFAEKGFKGVSVREVCKHADTSMNMIHHYYGSKAGLLEAIVAQFSSEVFAIPMVLLDKPVRSKEDFHSRFEMLFETTLDAYIAQRDVFMVVLREQASPEALPLYIKRLSKFLEDAKSNGFVRKELDLDLITGFMLDRILNQVQLAPWIEKTYGKSVMSDSDYKRRWCLANLDVLLNGIVI
jgi:AcrR family transcriptional regulator